MHKSLVKDTKLVASYSFDSGYIKYSLYGTLKEDGKKSMNPWIREPIQMFPNYAVTNLLFFEDTEYKLWFQ